MSMKNTNENLFGEQLCLGGVPVVGFGTVLGEHSVGETRDLINVLEWRTDKINQGWREIAERGLSNVALKGDPSFQTDLDAYLDRWISARRKAKLTLAAITLATPFVAESLVPSEGTYQDLLHATSATYPSYGKGDLPDVQHRLQAMRPNNPIDFSGMPNSNAPDFDLNAYRAADTVWKATGEPVQSFFEENKGKIAFGIGTVIAVVALIYAGPHIAKLIPERSK